MFRNYFTIAGRQLWRNQVFSAINVGGLAAGLAVALLIGLYVADEYGHDRFHRNFAQIYRVVESQPQADGRHAMAVTSAPLASALRRDFADVAQAVRVGQWGGRLQYGGKNLQPDHVLVVDKAFFATFDFPLLVGDIRTAFDNPDEIILTEKMTQFFFGPNWRNRNVLGQTIVLNSSQVQPLKLVGVAKDLPANSHLQADALLPVENLEKYDPNTTKWNSRNYHTYVLLRPGTNLPNLTRQLATYLRKYEAGSQTALQLQPLADIYLRSDFEAQSDWGKRGDLAAVRLFAAVGLLVLLIAVFNFVNLATARATQRAKEVGVRKLVGAGRGDLVQQFLTEALLTVTLAMALATYLASALVPLLNQLADKTLTVPVGQPTFWGMVLAGTLALAVLAGFYPALVLSSFRPARVLKGLFAIRSGRLLRQSLVVAQFATAIVLAISTAVIYRQLQFVQHKSLGFDQSQLLYVGLGGDLKANAARLKRDLLAIPGVMAVSATTNNLVNVANGGPIAWEGQPPKAELSVTQMNVDPDFLATAGATLAAGRNFSNATVSDTLEKTGAYLLNETAARRMGWTPAQALSKKVTFWDLEGRVVGVVKDFHFRPLTVPIEPFIFRYRPREFYFTLLVRTRPGQLATVLPRLSRAYARYEPDNPLSYGFVDQQLARQYGSAQRTSVVLLAFSLLTVVISCLGLFGLATLSIQQRTKEVGVRKVLGASVGQVTALLTKDFIRLVLIAFVVAAPLAWYAVNKWLQDFAYRTPVSWWLFALAGGLAFVIALLTVSYQAIRAARANPVESLRTE